MPFNIIQQTMIDGSVTGGPVVPTPTSPLIESTYSSLNVADTYVCNFERVIFARSALYVGLQRTSRM